MNPNKDTNLIDTIKTNSQYDYVNEQAFKIRPVINLENQKTLDPPEEILQSLNQLPNLSFRRKLTLDSKGNVYIGDGPIKTTDTNGFLYITLCAGAPTGIPTAITGTVPMVYDTIHHKFWIYDGGWKGVVLS